MSTQVDPAAQQDWKESLPPELRSDKAFEPIKDLAGLGKGFIEAQKFIGSAVRLPKADAPDEEWNKTYSRLGRPEKPEGYELKRPEGLPEGLQYDEEMETAFKSWAHEAGLHPRQAQRLLDKFNTAQLDRFKAQTASMEAAASELKKEWGGDYDKRVGFAKGTINELKDDKLVAWLEETGLSNHPNLVRVFAKLGENRAEATFVAGEPTGGETPDSIQLKIDELERDPKSALNDPLASVEAQEAAKRQRDALYKKLYPPSA